jgi:hypothetical protein
MSVKSKDTVDQQPNSGITVSFIPNRVLGLTKVLRSVFPGPSAAVKAAAEPTGKYFRRVPEKFCGFMMVFDVGYQYSKMLNF